MAGVGHWNNSQAYWIHYQLNGQHVEKWRRHWCLFILYNNNNFRPTAIDRPKTKVRFPGNIFRLIIFLSSSDIFIVEERDLSWWGWGGAVVSPTLCNAFRLASRHDTLSSVVTQSLSLPCLIINADRSYRSISKIKTPDSIFGGSMPLGIGIGRHKCTIC